jgi:hypothetical protein
VTIPDFCLACGRRYAPLIPTVADRNQVRYADPERPRLRLPVVLGALWWVAVVAIAVGLVAAAAWAVG